VTAGQVAEAPRGAQAGPGGAGRTVGIPAGAPPVITVRGLRKRYGELTVLDGLDLEVARGQLVALLGPNGAGKTTTVEIIEGYRRPDAGEVRVLGLDPHHDGPALRPRVGVMLQHGGITPQGRPGELVRLHARLFAHPADPDELLDLLGLAGAATRRYKLLSGGEKQRLALALALVGRPELLVLDEPTAGMDPAAKATVRALIADLRAAGRTILLTTHELADVERLADHVVVIDRGRVLAAGTPAELVAGASLVLRFRLAAPDGSAASVNAADLAGLGASLGGLIEADGSAGRHRLAGREPDPGSLVTLASWCAERSLLLAELRTTGGTLEERFLELIAEPVDESSAAAGPARGDGS
jgi:ABC-2 type transport system ATP-binding protein